MYDVVVVGAGIAGLMAAKELDCLVIDSRKEIGIPLRCGEGIRTEGFIELFEHTDYSFVENVCENLDVFVNGSKRTFNLPYLMLNRPKFEQWLAKGLNIQLNTKCVDIIEHKDHLEIITEEKPIKTKHAILAYGIQYNIQKKFKLLDQPPMLVPCVGGLFKGNVNTLSFFFDPKTYSCAWAFPKNGLINAGIGVFPFWQDKKIQDIFLNSLEKFNLKLEGTLQFGGSFPTTGPIKRTYTNCMLVCGDAAGQTCSGTGEGIYFALKSGKLAAQTINNVFKGKGTMKDYEVAWKKSFGKTLKCSIIATTAVILGFKNKRLENYFNVPNKKRVELMMTNSKPSFKIKLAYHIARIVLLLKIKDKKVKKMLRLMHQSYRLL